MNDKLSEASIVRTVARIACEAIAGRVMRALQKMDTNAIKHICNTSNAWDELCAQLQYERLLCWDFYEATVQQLVRSQIGKLAKHEYDAIWLQTDAASEWERLDDTRQDPYPVCLDDVVFLIANSYVYRKASQYRNERIRLIIDAFAGAPK